MTSQVPSARVNLFDYPTALVNGQTVRLSIKAFSLLAYLALEGRGLRSHLAMLLFSSAADRLNSLSVLRREILRVLGNEALQSDKSSLALGDVAVDLLEFEQSNSAQVRSKLYRGTLLRGQFARRADSEFDEWLESQRLRLLGLFQMAELELSRTAMRSKSWLEAIKRLEALATDTLSPREEALRLWLLGLVVSGQSGLVVSVFGMANRVFKQVFDLPFSAQTMRVFELARANDIKACWSLLELELLEVQTTQSGAVPLIGRESVLARMNTAWQAGKIILLSGAPGVGKTRLALEFSRAKGAVWHFCARPSDMSVPYSTHSRNYSTAFDLYPDVVMPSWIKTEMARIVPSLGNAPSPVANDQEQLRFFEAQAEAYRYISFHANIATMVIDDAQFVDEYSAQAGIHLHAKFLPYQPGFPRTIFAFRTGEFKPHIEAGLRQWVEFGIAEWIDLMPLTPTDTQQCLKHLDARLTPLSTQMTAYTGGNPMLLLETARFILEQGVFDASQLQLPRHEGIFAVTKARLERLPAQALLLLRLLAIMDGHVELQTTQVVLGWSDQDLKKQILILEEAHVAKNNQVAHDLILEVILASIPPNVWGHLHSLALRILESAGGLSALRLVHAVAANDTLAVEYYQPKALQEASDLGVFQAQTV